MANGDQNQIRPWWESAKEQDSVQSLIDSYNAEIERQENQAEIERNYPDLVSAYPNARSTIKSMRDEGVHKLETIAGIAEQEENDKEQSAFDKVWNTDESIQRWKQALGNPNKQPSELDKYDYKTALKEGARPTFDPESAEWHWPSKYKADDHPNRFITVEGKKYDTKNERYVMDAWDVLKETPWQQYIPFLSGLKEASGIYEVYEAAQRLQNNEETKDDLLLLKEWTDEQRADKTFMAQVTEVLTQLPAFATELAATWGLYGFGSKAAIKGTSKLLKKLLKDGTEELLDKKMAKLGLKVVGGIAGGTVQTPVAGATRIRADYFRRTLPQFEISESEHGDLEGLITGPGDDVGPALAKAFGNQWVETVSEHSGGLFQHIGRSAFVKAFLKKNPTAKVSNVDNIVKRFGWNGVFNEMLEERVGDVGRAALGLEQFELPTMEQLAVELVAFSVPGAAISGTKRVVEGKTVKAEGTKVQEELDRAYEAGEIDRETYKLTSYLASQEEDIDEKTALNISNELKIATKEYIKKTKNMTLEEFYKDQGIEFEKDEEGDVILTGATQVEKDIGKNLISLWKGADSNTIVEEWYHAHWNRMTPEEKTAFTEYHDQSGDTRSVEEHFGKEGADFFFNNRMNEQAYTGLRDLYTKLKDAFMRMVGKAQNIDQSNIPEDIAAMYGQVGKAEGPAVEDASVQFQAKRIKLSSSKKANNERKFIEELGKDYKVYKNPLNPGEYVMDDVGAFSIGGIFDEEDVISLDAIRSFEKGIGTGTEILNRLKKVSDKLGIDIQGDATPFGEGGLNKQQLIDWYEKNGFLVDKDNIYYEAESEKPKTQFQAKKVQLDKDVKPKSKEFKSWFGDSKVVDEKGEPLVVYHGTVKEFDQFKVPEEYDPDTPTLTAPGSIYFSDDPIFVNSYTTPRFEEPGDAAQVYPVYLNIENPYNLLNLNTKEDREIATELDKEIYNKGVTPAVIRKMKAAGYDGTVSSHDDMYDNQEIVSIFQVFEPNQVKGQFNEKPTKEDPRIMFQAKKASDLQLSNIPIKKQESYNTLSQYLDERAQSVAKALGVDLTKDTDETKEIMSDVIAEELKTEIKNNKNALGWYSVKMDKAIDLLSKLYPDLKKDPVHNQVFKIALAIRSNGADVDANLDMAITSYQYWVENGVLPTSLKRGGKEMGAMRSAFNLYNTLVKEHGVDWVHNDLINGKWKVSDLNKSGIKKIDEHAGQVVMGSAVFGPKVGGGFLANLNGHYEYLTMDRWFMRTMGRIRGNQIENKDYSQQLKTFTSLLRKSKSAMKRFGISKEDLSDQNKMIEAVKKIQKEYAKGKFNPKTKKKTTFFPKTKLNLSSNATFNRLDTLRIQPTAAERPFFRAVMEDAVKKSGIKNLTMADAQAIIWFPEKRLYRKFGVGSKRAQKETDYEIEAKELVRRRSDDTGRRELVQRQSSTQPGKVSQKTKAAQKSKEVSSPQFQAKKATDVAKKKFGKSILSSYNKKNKSLELKDATVWQYLVHKIQDNTVRLRLLTEGLMTVENVKDEDDLYLMTTLMTGKAGDRINNFNDDIYINKKSLMQRVIDAGFTLDEFGKFMMAQHARQRNKYIHEKGGPRDGGSGMSNSDAAQVKKMYSAAKKKKIEAFAKEFREKVLQKDLKNRLDAGLISQKDYDLYSKRWEFYVPLKVDMGKKGIIGVISKIGGKGYDVRGKEYFGIRKGHKDKPTINPVFSGIVQHQEGIVRAEKNEVAKSMLRLVNKHKSSAWSVRGQRGTPRFNEYGEMVFFDYEQLKDNEMLAKVDGKSKIITIEDDLMANALKNIDKTQAIGLMRPIMNYLRLVITTMNPHFFISNFQRDIQTALINISGEQSAAMAAKIAANLPRSWKGIWTDVISKKDSEWAQLYKELKATGGKVGWFNIGDIEEQRKEIQTQLGRLSKGKANPRNVAKRIGDWANNLNEVVESGTRLAAYKAAIDSGMSKKRAAFLAKEITVNFNRTGALGPKINSLFLFWNATMQGAFRVGTSIAKNPKTRALAAGVAANGAYQAWLARSMCRETWEKIPEWEKDNNHLFIGPDCEVYYKMRVPFGYNVFHVMGSVAMDAALDHQQDGIPLSKIDYGKKIGRVLGSIGDAVNPFGAGVGGYQYIPTAGRPFLELKNNVKWNGAPIKPETFFDEIPESRKYYEGVSPSAKAITDWLSKVSGGKELPYEGFYDPGLVELSPEDLEYIMDFIGGGTGKFIKQLIDTGKIIVKEGTIKESRRVPFLRLFKAEVPLRAEKSWVYKHLKQSRIKKYPGPVLLRYQAYVGILLQSGQIDEKEASRITTIMTKNQQKLNGVYVEPLRKRRRRRTRKTTRKKTR